jgi:hypothetical protein
MWRTLEDSAQMFQLPPLRFWMHHIIWMEVKLKEASHPLRKCFSTFVAVTTLGHKTCKWSCDMHTLFYFT